MSKWYVEIMEADGVTGQITPEVEAVDAMTALAVMWGVYGRLSPMSKIIVRPAAKEATR